MFDIIEDLSWDSEFFGFPIGQFKTHQLNEDQLQQALAWAQENRLRCLYFQAHPDDATTVSLIEKQGFHLVDVRLILMYKLQEQGETPENDKIWITPPNEADKK